MTPEPITNMMNTYRVNAAVVERIHAEALNEIEKLRAQNKMLKSALCNLAGAFHTDDAWWETEGLVRHEGTGKSCKEIQRDVLNEAFDVLEGAK